MAGTQDLIFVFDCVTKKFSFAGNMLDCIGNRLDNTDIFQLFAEDVFVATVDFDIFSEKLKKMIESDTVQLDTCRFALRSDQENDSLNRWCLFTFICSVPRRSVILSIKDISREVENLNHLTRISEYDELTGLMNRRTFCHNIANFFSLMGEEMAGKYAIVYFDIIKFKAINDLFGKSGGDLLLLHITDVIHKNLSSGEFACRLNSDRFALFINTVNKNVAEFIDSLIKQISGYSLPIKVNCNMGIYIIDDPTILPSLMLDRAILVQSTIKGIYTERFKFYTPEIRWEMLSEQEIIGSMAIALDEKQFIPYYQPQFNHSTGRIEGAEALVRWNHPEKGLVSPAVFIPIFEKNGFITPLDMYIFERVCEFLGRCLDKGLKVVPISTNFSRYDIFQEDFVEKLEESRKKYDVPIQLLRIEITESAVFGGNEMTNEVVHKLHDCGYVVEMDDFGSGYSSLNVLKDIDFDIIKLDMKFLSDRTCAGRGGTVLTSVVNMAKWLNLSVIAEGVESVTQADFLSSIGADCIQGYLYSKPLPENQFVDLLKDSPISRNINNIRAVEVFNAIDFWNPDSKESIVFNNFVGPAAIFKFRNDSIEVLCMNKKYLKEFGMNLEDDIFQNIDFLDMFDSENKQIFLDNIHAAIEEKKEVEFETWRKLSSTCCGSDSVCIRSNLQVVGKRNDSYLLYVLIRNVTAEQQFIMELRDSERRFMYASEQVKIYFWEYDVATKDMRPCFRCRRDLGLPPVIHNYPEPVIENGIFPQDYADMYREWHRNIEKGVKEQEAVIPLTKDRIPFRVRYSTEFDAVGHPIRAYGSAALIIDEKQK